ncbi:MAG: methyltransferase domain-containing protein [Bordetella sp.]|uniref:methyltransferase domain-containing protein n=1 Tax=Bordetella sp. TaxID=28081 RepID=UPI003F7BD9D8
MRACLKCKHVFSSDAWRCPACGYEPISLAGITAHAPEFANAGGGFKPEYFAELARLEATNFWFRARNSIILWALNTYAPDTRSFLEVGCGTGFVLSGIAKAHPDMALHGSEIFLDGLSHAVARVHGAQFMQMDARRVPFVDEFDSVGIFDVLEHIEEDTTVLAQLHRSLKPGGTLFLTVPQHRWLWSASDTYACHIRRYTKSELHEKVIGAGFSIERSTSFVSLLLPALLLSRGTTRKLDENFDSTTEFRLPGFLNAFLLGVMLFERRLISCGISFPLGGSRLVVARKVNS